MNSVHDMGGMDGFGPVEVEEDEPVFHDPWEGRVFGLFRGLGPWNRGRNFPWFRFALESIPPDEYLRMSYYERWFEVLSNNLRRAGTAILVSHFQPNCLTRTERRLLHPKLSQGSA